MNDATMMSARCSLVNPTTRRMCGVNAAGRCARCQSAFCSSHRGHYYDRYDGWVPAIDQCVYCARIQQVAKGLPVQQSIDVPSVLLNIPSAPSAPRELFSALEYGLFKCEQARLLLLESGVDVVRLKVKEWYVSPLNGFLGDESHYRDTEDIHHGWLLGELRWVADTASNRAAFDSSGIQTRYDDSIVVHICLSMLLNSIPVQKNYYAGKKDHYDLIPVHLTAGGYEFVQPQDHDLFTPDERLAVYYIKKLAGK